MRTEITTEFQAQAEADQSAPIELYDVYLGTQDSVDSLTYFWCTGNQKIQFYDLDGNARTYNPMRSSRSQVPSNSQLEVQEIDASLDNTDRVWSNWLASNSTTIRGKRIVIRKIFLDLLTDPTHCKVLFDGQINGARELSEKSVTLAIKSKFHSLEQETGCPQQLYCNYIFGDEFCGFDADSTKVTGATIDADSTTTIIKDNERLEGNDYWTSGTFEATSGQNIGQKRRVHKYDSAQRELILDYALPYTPAAGDTYAITQRCNNTYDVCKNRFSNQANYEGQKFIPPLINPKL